MPEEPEESIEKEILKILIGSAKNVFYLIGSTKRTPDEIKKCLDDLEASGQVEFVPGEGWKLKPPEKRQ